MRVAFKFAIRGKSTKTTFNSPTLNWNLMKPALHPVDKISPVLISQLFQHSQDDPEKSISRLYPKDLASAISLVFH